MNPQEASPIMLSSITHKQIGYSACLFVAAVLAYFFVTMPAVEERGQRYLDDLIELIEKSDEVRLVEHSERSDYGPLGTEGANRSKEVVYRSAILTGEQEVTLVSMLESTDAEVSKYKAACKFIVHHRLEFYRDSKLHDVMHICFACGEIRWNGSRGSKPSHLSETLREFVLSMGFEPKRDWKGLATQAPT